MMSFVFVLFISRIRVISLNTFEWHMKSRLFNQLWTLITQRLGDSGAAYKCFFSCLFFLYSVYDLIINVITCTLPYYTCLDETDYLWVFERRWNIRITYRYYCCRCRPLQLGLATVLIVTFLFFNEIFSRRVCFFRRAENVWSNCMV